MSGGVDSSTVAAMMKNEGYNVIGITLKLYNDSKETSFFKTMLCRPRYYGCKKSS